MKVTIAPANAIAIGMIAFAVILVVVVCVRQMLQRRGQMLDHGRCRACETGHTKCYDCQNRTSSAIEYQLGFPAPLANLGHV